MPTVRDGRPVNIMVDETQISLDLWDSIGSPDYDRVRQLSYPNTDVFMICFSLADNGSFQNVQTKWAPEVMSNCPGVPYFLVGTKQDLRYDKDTIQKLHEQGLDPLEFQKGKTMAKEIKAVKYLECSALLKSGLQDLVDEAVRTVLRLRQKKKDTVCLIN